MACILRMFLGASARLIKDWSYLGFACDRRGSERDVGNFEMCAFLTMMSGNALVRAFSARWPSIVGGHGQPHLPHSQDGLENAGDILEAVMGLWRSNHDDVPPLREIEPALHLAFITHLNSGLLAIKRLRDVAGTKNSRISSVHDFVFELEEAHAYWP
jgi:hypothetical protein